MGEVEIQTATKADLPEVFRAEEHWPEDQRASDSGLRTRLERFPEGFHLAFEEDRLVGFSTSCPAQYDPTDLEGFASWKRVTNDGFLHPPDAGTKSNALYVVSTLVRREDRAGQILAKLAVAQWSTAERLGFEFVLTGATLPGYDAHCRKHGECHAAEYALAQHRGRPRDPLLRILSGFGLQLPDARHVIPDYYPSPASRDYGALLVARVAYGPPQDTSGRL